MRCSPLSVQTELESAVAARGASGVIGRRGFHLIVEDLQLLAAYGGQFAITDCPVEALLEAAHILPYRGKETNVVQNGLLCAPTSTPSLTLA